MLGKQNKVFLLPRDWELDATPIFGANPQAIIDDQIVDDADIVLALIWHRLGTPTPEAESGTVHEIKRSVAAGKPVYVFFSLESVPHDVSTAQLDAARQFKDWCRDKGVYAEFTDAGSLEGRAHETLNKHVQNLQARYHRPIAVGLVCFQGYALRNQYVESRRIFIHHARKPVEVAAKAQIYC